MIQRIQTVFLLLGALVGLGAMMMPIMTFTHEGLTIGQMYNLWMVNAHGGHELTSWPLFAIQLASITIALLSIFMYSNRRRQMRMVMLSICLLILWYIAAGCMDWLLAGDNDMRLNIGAWLPLVSIILYRMAYYRINKDEELVRSADRIR